MLSGFWRSDQPPSPGAGALALLVILIFGLLFWQKRQESTFNLAANFREMGISELAGNNPLAAEVLFARALSLTDNLGARERLLEARAKSPRLLWISPTLEDAALLGISSDGSLFAVATPLDLSIWSSLSRSYGLSMQTTRTQDLLRLRPILLSSRSDRTAKLNFGTKVILGAAQQGHFAGL